MKYKTPIRCCVSDEWLSDFSQRTYKGIDLVKRLGFIVGEVGNCWNVKWDGNKSSIHIGKGYIKIIEDEKA